MAQITGVTTTFADTFTEGVSDTRLDSHTPDTGTGWTSAGADHGDFYAYCSSAFDNLFFAADDGTGDTYYLCDDTGSADGFVEASHGVGIANANLHLCVRLQDFDNHINYHRTGTGSVGARLGKMVAGVLTDSIISFRSNAVDDYITIRAEGTSVGIYKNGTQQSTDATISNFSTETSKGLIAGASANQWWDNFSAGTLTAAGSNSPSGSPSSTPSGSPSATPSGSPSGSPSSTPSGSPSVTPSNSPSNSPSGSPSSTPSNSPSASPSSSPSNTPSSTPSASPSSTPSGSPSSTPSSTPSASPSGSPSASPSGAANIVIEDITLTYVI